jgi:hypothetical protein
MTSEDREDIRRLFGVVTEDLLSKVQQVAEGVAAGNRATERSYAEFDAFRVETGRSFSDVARQFSAVRKEMAAGFAAVRSEIAGSRTSTPLPRRPRTRRRPN